MAGGEDLRQQGDTAEGHFSLVVLVATVLENLPILVGVPILMFVLGVGFAFLAGWNYRSTSMFQPETRDSGGSRLSAIAAQFGVGGAAFGGGGESVQFYTTLLESRDLLREAVLTDYVEVTGVEHRDTARGNLVELLEVEGDTPEGEVRAAITWLNDHTSASANLDAGVVTLRVTARSPALAEAINRRLLELLDQFNRIKRQSRAREEREFVERRMESIQEELQQAEEALARFLEQNRSYQSSPELAFQAQRLQRKVDERQQTLTTLIQAYETARIDEVRDTPVLTVVDDPENSAVRMGGPLSSGKWGFAIGILLAIAFVLVRGYVDDVREQSPTDLRALEAARKRLGHRVRGLFASR